MADAGHSLFDGLGNPDMVEVGVGELAIAEYPQYLMTPALGSCIGLALYDKTSRRGGLAHLMLPSPADTAQPGDERRFASSGIPLLVKMLSDAGSPRRRLTAKIAGGAAMFKSDTTLATIGAAQCRRGKEPAGTTEHPRHCRRYR